VSFFGDGASNNGVFHESLNFASLHKLPVVFVCENNQYGISVHQKRHQPIEDIAIRATSYNMPGVVVDGNDVIAVYKETYKAVKRARAGEGPTLIECKTYRWRGHHEGDPNQGARYRTKEEIEEWKKKCPIKRLEEKLLGEKIATKSTLEEIEKEIQREIDEAVEFAEKSPFPELQDIYDDVYVPESWG
ncbi:MAG TPA: pyruvate dehydrogenase (acetyl-transferring) E1 component subunit alpha, partial [Deltaproteobacteria bacterium]|nr:pyruvate dehydrogenase (acetyl-transferring) E1 component subunit alpha [Deltaproteobacteria bacterium]